MWNVLHNPWSFWALFHKAKPLSSVIVKLNSIAAAIVSCNYCIVLLLERTAANNHFHPFSKCPCILPEWAASLTLIVCIICVLLVGDSSRKEFHSTWKSLSSLSWHLWPFINVFPCSFLKEILSWGQELTLWLIFWSLEYKEFDPVHVTLHVQTQYLLVCCLHRQLSYLMWFMTAPKPGVCKHWN